MKAWSMLAALGQSCVSTGRARRLRAAEADKVLLAPLPATSTALAAHPLLAEKLMPVLGVVRSPSVEHAIAACELVTEHGGLGHTSAVYATDEQVINAFALAIRTGQDPRQRSDRGRSARRRLQLDDADLLAGMWDLGRLEHDRQRELPQPAQHQGGLTPAVALSVVPGPVRTRTSIPARSENLRMIAPRQVMIVTDGPDRGARRRRRDPEVSRHRRRACVLGHRARARRGRRSAPACRSCIECRPTRSSRSVVAR